MRFYENLGVKAKIMGLIALLMSMNFAGNIYLELKVAEIGDEIEAVAERDMPLVGLISKIEAHQLEQAIHFERILRLADLGSPKEGQLEKEIKLFTTLADKVDKELLEAGEVITSFLKLSDLSQKERKEMEFLLKSIKKLEHEHAEYDEHAKKIFFAYGMGQTGPEIDELIHMTAEEEDQITKEVEEILFEIERFTQEALLEAEHHEHDVERLMLITAVSILLIGLGLGWLMGKSMAKSIHDVSDVTEHLAQGGLNQKIPSQDLNNEVGTIARALVVFKDNLKETRKLRQEQEAEKLRAEERQRIALNQMAVRSGFGPVRSR